MGLQLQQNICQVAYRDSSEWELLPQIFHQIYQIKGTLEITLFASRLSRQPPKYFAWRPDPYSQGTDAMQHPWGNKYFYAFPPFSMINKVLNKVKISGNEAYQQSNLG